MYTLCQLYLSSLEGPNHIGVDPIELIERLERLAQLHKKGDLDDAQFEQAKKALGL